MPITFVTAALGGTVEVPTLDGEVIFKIPAETQSGRVFRMREKGVRPVRGGAAGDLFCRVVVETPVSLRGEQKEMLRKFAELAGAGQPSPQGADVFRGREEVLYARGRDRGRAALQRLCPTAHAADWFRHYRPHGTVLDSRPCARHSSFICAARIASAGSARLGLGCRRGRQRRRAYSITRGFAGRP